VNAQAEHGGWFGRLLVGPWFWLLLIAAMASFPVLYSLTHQPAPATPVLGELRPFEAVDHLGRRFGALERLGGKVWVASATCTQCPQRSPVVLEHLKLIRHRSRNLGDAFRLVTWSLDPEADTPQQLAELARSLAMSPGWVFLTGPAEATLGSLAEALSQAPDARHLTRDVVLTERVHLLVLVDQRMRVRGYYDGRDPQEVARLVVDMGLLVNRGPDKVGGGEP
jgi:protein SCO1/2